MKDMVPLSFVFPEDGGTKLLRNLGMISTKLRSVTSQKTVIWITMFSLCSPPLKTQKMSVILICCPEMLRVSSYMFRHCSMYFYLQRLASDSLSLSVRDAWYCSYVVKTYWKVHWLKYLALNYLRICYGQAHCQCLQMARFNSVKTKINLHHIKPLSSYLTENTVSIRRSNRWIVYREIIAVYCRSQIKHTHTHSVGKMQFLALSLAVHKQMNK